MHQRRPHLRRAAATLAAGLAVAAALASAAPAGAVAPPATLPDNDEIFQTIKELTSQGPRRTGTPAGDFAANYVASKLRSYGLQDVRVEDTPSYKWEYLDHALQIGGQSVDAFPSFYSQSFVGSGTGTRSTPAGGLDAEVVDVGAGGARAISRADVRGKIVMFDLKFELPLVAMLPLTQYLQDSKWSLIRDPAALKQANPYITNYQKVIEAAQKGGAVGFVGVLADYFDSNRYANEFYRRLAVLIPGMWLSPIEGDRVRREVISGPGTRARMTLVSRRTQVMAHQVTGVLPGRSTDAILVQSHHDSVWMGGVEDGSGTAEVLALAKHFAAQPAGSRRKSLMFATNDTHFSGYQGHSAWVRKYITQRNPRTEPHRIVGSVALEHVAKHATVGPNHELRVSDQPEPRAIFANVSNRMERRTIAALRRNRLERTALLGTDFTQLTGVPTDASFHVLAGIPTLSLIAGPIYLYDEADTLDMVAKDQLQPVAQTFAELIDDMDAQHSEYIGPMPLWLSTSIGRRVFEQSARLTQ